MIVRVRLPHADASGESDWTLGTASCVAPSTIGAAGCATPAVTDPATTRLSHDFSGPASTDSATTRLSHDFGGPAITPDSTSNSPKGFYAAGTSDSAATRLPHELEVSPAKPEAASNSTTVTDPVITRQSQDFSGAATTADSASNGTQSFNAAGTSVSAATRLPHKLDASPARPDAAGNSTTPGQPRSAAAAAAGGAAALCASASCSGTPDGPSHASSSDPHMTEDDPSTQEPPTPSGKQPKTIGRGDAKPGCSRSSQRGSVAVGTAVVAAVSASASCDGAPDGSSHASGSDLHMTEEDPGTQAPPAPSGMQLYKDARGDASTGCTGSSQPCFVAAGTEPVTISGSEARSCPLRSSTKRSKEGYQLVAAGTEPVTASGSEVQPCPLGSSIERAKEGFQLHLAEAQWARYGKSNLRSVLQMMGCKARHAHKVRCILTCLQALCLSFGLVMLQITQLAFGVVRDLISYLGMCTVCTGTHFVSVSPPPSLRRPPRTCTPSYI